MSARDMLFRGQLGYPSTSTLSLVEKFVLDFTLLPPNRRHLQDSQIFLSPTAGSTA